MNRGIGTTVGVVVLLIVTGVATPIAAAQTDTNATAASTADPSITISDVTVSPQSPLTGENVIVNATVRNGASSSGGFDITQVTLTGSDSRVTTDDLGTLSPGDAITVPLSTSFDSDGQKRLTVTVRGRNPDGTISVVDRPVYVDVEEATVRPELSTTSTVRNGSSVIEASLTEYGTVDLENVQVQAVVDGEPVVTRSIADVAGGETGTAVIDESDVPTGEVTIVARYTANGQQGNVTDTIQFSPQRTADVTLTGVEVTRQGTALSLSGEIGNVGISDLGSVIVRVGDASGVEGVAPDGEYYVGEIEANEFNTFELTAEASADVERVPIQVTFAANGEQYSKTVTVDAASGGAQNASSEGASGASGDTGAPGGMGAPGGAGAPGQSGGGLPLLEIGVGIVVIGGVVLVYRWRKQ